MRIGTFESDGVTPMTVLTTDKLSASGYNNTDWYKVVLKVVRDDEPQPIVIAIGAEVSLVGDTQSLWQLAPDIGEVGTPLEYGATLTLGEQIDETTGVGFWARARSLQGEMVRNDSTVDIVVNGVAEVA